MRWRAVAAALVAVVLAVLLVVVLTGADSLCGPTAWRCRSINDYRVDHQLPRLEQRAGLQSGADAYADQLAQQQVLVHADTTAAEVIGYGATWRQIMRLWDRSRPHRRILRDPDLTRMGIGTKRDPAGTLWAVVRFR